MKHIQIIHGIRNLLLAVIFLSQGEDSAISVAPINVAVHEGDANTTILCVSDWNTVDWVLLPFSYPSGPPSPYVIYITSNGQLVYPYDTMYTIAVPEPNARSLVIHNATIAPSLGPQSFSTAGVYQCYEYQAPNAQGAAAQLDLTQYGTANVTNSTYVSSGQSMQLTCTFVHASSRFTYLIDAILTWSVDGQSIPGANFSINETSDEIIAISTITIHNNYYDQTYECKAIFASPSNDPTAGYAKNAPAYSKTCDFTYREPNNSDWLIILSVVLGLLLIALLATVTVYCFWSPHFFMAKDTDKNSQDNRSI